MSRPLPTGPKAVEALDSVASPSLMAKLEAWRSRARPFDAEVALKIREMKTHLDDRDWWHNSFELTERPVADDIAHDLREQVPQALLRDLYRPVRPDQFHPFEEIVPPLDRAGLAAMAEARAAQVLEPVPVFTSLWRMLRETRDAHRAFLAERWEPYLTDDEPRRYPMPAIGF